MSAGRPKTRKPSAQRGAAERRVGGGGPSRHRAPQDGPRKEVRLGLPREPGFVYFVDPDGDVARAALGATRLGVPRKVARLGVARDPAYLYFIDADGDVARVKRAIP